MLKIIAPVLLILMTVSCSSDDTNVKDTLRIGIPFEPTTLYGSIETASARINLNIYDRLIEKEKDGSFSEGLATEWEMLSPTELKLTLRTNAQFHNGEYLTPEDVQYTIERAINTPEINSIASPIKSVDIIDGDTVVMHLHAPFAPILSHLTHSAMAVLNKKAMEEAGADYDQIAVGTGPYILQEWNRGQNVVLTANENYWDGAPNIQNLDFMVIPDNSARSIALETGDVDVVYDIDFVDRERIAESPALNLIEEPVASIEYFGFNTGKGSNPIWQDNRVREAVALAIDREGIIDNVIFGAGTPASSIIYDTVIGRYDGLTPRERNVAKAKELLAEAGVTNGTKVNLSVYDGRQKMAEVIQANLKEIGLDVSIEVSELSRFIDSTSKGEHDTYILGWVTVTGDADYGIYNLIHSDSWGGPGNASFYSNTVVDNLLDQARVEIDSEKRDKLYEEVQVILDEELPIFPLYYRTLNVGTSKDVKDFTFNPTGAYKLKSASLQKS